MKRLVTETDDVFERTLLESVRLDELPQPGARQAALALEFALRNLPVAPNPGLAHPAGASSSVGTVGLWKWLGIGVVVGGVAGAGAMASYDRAVVFATARAPATASTVATRAPLPVAPAETVPGTASLPPSPSPLPLPSAAARAKTPSAVSTERSPEGTSRASVTDSASTLAAEAAAIDAARRALSAGSPSSAIDLLNRYDRESPTHALEPDAQALRIQAEKARGNDAVATKLAEKFLTSHPNDPHADRVRRVLAGARRP